MSTPAVASRLEALVALGTSVWLDFIRRGLIGTGELDRLRREDCVSGITANPSIFEKAILGSSDYDQRLAELTAQGRSVQEIYETLAVEDVRGAADVMSVVHRETDAVDGYASLEVAPALAHDEEGTVASVRDFWARLGRPNAYIKIPGTDEGAPAIRRSIAAGINVNVTLLFSLDAYEKIADAYISGLEDRVERGEPIHHVTSVASFFVSRVDTAVDQILARAGREDLAGRAAVANARLAYARFQEITAGERWRRLAEHGAQPQRLLWASTGTKNPRYSDVKYVEELAGPHTVNTMPMATLLAFRDHGETADRLTGAADEARATIAEIERAGVSMAEVTERLLEDGIALFDDAMTKLLAGIDRRRSALIAGKPARIGADLREDDARAVHDQIEWARAHDVVRRVWSRDHTLWSPSPDEIVDRMGWLTIGEKMLEHADDLVAFTDEVRRDGFTHCALLGMGGSSLAPEVLHRTFGTRPGYLDMHVLDSTHPDAVRRLADRLPLDRTLFVVSSKSGGTLEPRTFYAYFRHLVDDGGHFVAITDPGTALAAQAGREGFRRAFLNDPTIGGRYSALSYFGLVPAALMGVDVHALLERAEVAVHAAQPGVPYEENPALWLGLAAGALARRGRDKVTMVVSEPLGSFGLWAEQLIAESSGKQGRGLVPVAGEPLGDPAAYGDDRLFIHLRNERQPDAETDARLAALADAGHPVMTIPFAEPVDLGSQFFAWEFGVAVACAVIGVNAFDQPNVQEAKDLTVETITAYVREGRFPEERPLAASGALAVFGPDPGAGVPPPGGVAAALAGMLSQAAPGDYAAVLAFLAPDDETDALLTRLRVAVRDARRAATTVGYGPRYLHSTGQLHKGGPPAGRFLQITDDGRPGVDVPGEGYDFAALVRAQGIGDLAALRRRHLPALRVHLSGAVAPALRELVEAVEAAAVTR